VHSLAATVACIFVLFFMNVIMTSDDRVGRRMDGCSGFE